MGYNDSDWLNNNEEMHDVLSIPRLRVPLPVIGMEPDVALPSKKDNQHYPKRVSSMSVKAQHSDGAHRTTVDISSVARPATNGSPSPEVDVVGHKTRRSRHLTTHTPIPSNSIDRQPSTGIH
jgi:hypothetical protein